MLSPNKNQNICMHITLNLHVWVYTHTHTHTPKCTIKILIMSFVSHRNLINGRSKSFNYLFSIYWLMERSVAIATWGRGQVLRGEWIFIVIRPKPSTQHPNQINWTKTYCCNPFYCYSSKGTLPSGRILACIDQPADRLSMLWLLIMCVCVCGRDFWFSKLVLIEQLHWVLYKCIINLIESLQHRTMCDGILRKGKG